MGAAYAQDLVLYRRAVNRQKHDRDRIYSLHRRIAKGKPHKPYEFGNKVGITTSGVKERKIIMAVKAFEDTPCDGHTTAPPPCLLK